MIYTPKKILAAAALVLSTTGLLQANCQPLCEPAPTCCNPCGHLIVGAEVLYLRAYEGGLSNNCDDIEIINDGDISLLFGQNHDPDAKWDLGFRIGVGYEFANSNCDLSIYWTSYDSKSSGGRDETRHEWEIDYDVVDAIYRCDCNWSACCALSPYLGVRYAKIDQSLQKNTNMIIDEIEHPSRYNIKEDFWGVGPVFGIEADLALKCGFSLYGNVSAGVLYGQYDVNSRKVTELTTVTNFDRLDNDTHAFPIVLDFGIGVRWRTCVCNDKYITLHLGLEEHRYFNHNQFCGYGDLSLAGANFGASFEF